jgi:hypothetical protein
MKTVLRWCMSPQLAPLLLPIAGQKAEGNNHQEDGSLATPQHPEQASIEQA